MNRVRSITAGVLALGVLFGAAAAAQGPRGFGGRGGGVAGVALGGLNLTEAQRQQVRDIRERHREAAQRAAERVRQASEAQRKAIVAVPVNEGQIRSTTQALAEAQTEAAIQQATVYNEVWNLLTEEQRAQVQKLQSERGARAGRRRG